MSARTLCHGCRLWHQCRDVLGTSPADGDARPAVPVVVDDRNRQQVTVELEPDLRASRPKSDDGLEDTRRGQLWRDVDAAVDYRGGLRWVGLGVPAAHLEGAAENAVLRPRVHVRPAPRMLL